MTDYKFIKVIKSDKANKKYMAIFKNLKTNKEKRVYFGASGYEDYITSKNKNKKQLYIARHSKREDWNDSGILTAGWWSRWLLWNEPSYTKSLSIVKDKLKKAGY